MQLFYNFEIIILTINVPLNLYLIIVRNSHTWLAGSIYLLDWLISVCHFRDWYQKARNIER